MQEDELLKIVRVQEDQIRMQRFEAAYFWDWQGNLLLVKAGELSRITFTKAEIARVTGAIATHNHPLDWQYSEKDSRRAGNCFSASDARLACLASLSILRVVTPRVRYMLKPPPQGWDANYWQQVLAHKYRQQYDLVWAELKAQVQSRKMLSANAYAAHGHELWQRLATSLGLYYTREEF